MKTATVATVATVAVLPENGGFMRVYAECRDSVATNAATLRQQMHFAHVQACGFSDFGVLSCPESGAAADGVGGSAFGAADVRRMLVTEESKPERESRMGSTGRRLARTQ